MKTAAAAVVLVAVLAAVAGTAPAGRAITYAEARPILDVLRTELLPPELQPLSPADRETVWPDWVTGRDHAIRERLDRGDEDALVSLLLFGVTFTAQPRYSFAALARDPAAQGRAAEIVAADPSVRRRIADLTQAAAAPGSNERLQVAREVLDGRGITLTTSAGRQAAEQFLLGALQRMVAEYDDYFRERAAGATLFRQRGLASDTTIHTAFAVDRALADLAAGKQLAPGAVRRIAVIGPGLDFADKQEGLDVYPLQTIQPFAAIDSLARLGLARPETVRVATFDLNPRVNQHIARAADAARAGQAYTLQLPRDEAQRWEPALVSYWENAGASVGENVPPIALPPGVAGVRMRAVRVRPAVVETLTPYDLNVVLGRLDLAGDERFDLVIATNILLYYEVVEQSLALANIAAMLRPGGFLLTNTPLFELPTVPMRLAGETAVVYMDGGRDWVIWYERQ